MSREKTVSHSFRINEDALRKIMDEAKAENVSVNTFVNQLLIGYASFDRLVRPFGMVKLTLPTFRRILSALTEKEAEETGEWSGENVSKGFIESSHGSVSMENILEYFQNWSAHGGFFQYNEARSGDGLIMTLTHDLGRKGSLWLKGYALKSFKNANIQATVTSISDGSISFSIPKEPSSIHA